MDEYLLKLIHPGIQRVSQIKGHNVRRMAYIASYVFLIQYLQKQNVFPRLTLYKDTEVESKDVDMVVDIGNSRTTALLIEDNTTFNQVRHLQLTDYTNPVDHINGHPVPRTWNEPFDMRLAFRKVSFGDFGPRDSMQFVYPSLVRLGQEANTLIHRAIETDENHETLSTHSSPKRFLWDGKPIEEEWKFLVLSGETDDHILHINGITNQLQGDGRLDPHGQGGQTYKYSRRSLMTFAFLEMLVQATIQVNSEAHRSARTGFGKPNMPRHIRRILVTCPTAMSREERTALIKCAQDAVTMHRQFQTQALGEGVTLPPTIEVVPAVRNRNDNEPDWYYDEATCSQFVYMYGEAGYKYKGCCSEFFQLYGKTQPGESQPSITVGSLDIGAGTSDLIINRYTYEHGDVTTITPDPLFYDSFYYAGDDMLYALIKNVMILDEESAFRLHLSQLSRMDYRQRMKNFFGKDYNGQSAADRSARREFNIQYSIPLMSYMLELQKNGAKDCTIHYEDVFGTCPPNQRIIQAFADKTGIDVTTIAWQYNRDKVTDIISKEFEPLLKKIATIMYSHACDIILLSGRPASLPSIRNIFLKYYAVSPNRLIRLNDYYIGDWYPFGENTGHIRDAKTVVAIGGVIAHYASELSNLNKFAINTDKLKENLHSTVNYISHAHDGQPIQYLITPQQSRADMVVSSLPETLQVRQLGMDSYPCRTLYHLDFNRQKIADRLKKSEYLTSRTIPTDAQLKAMVKASIDKLKGRMPLHLTIERDMEDQEKLHIVSITDAAGNDVVDSNLEIHIQSLGAEEQYWLDSGAFDF